MISFCTFGLHLWYKYERTREITKEIYREEEWEKCEDCGKIRNYQSKLVRWNENEGIFEEVDKERRFLC